MLTSWRLILVIAGIFIVALVVSLVTIRKGNKAQLALPVTLSITALIVSICGAFRAELFPFNPRAFVGEFFIVKTGEGNPVPGFLVTLDFGNDGYGEGFIQDLIIRVTKDSRSFCMGPSVEIDRTQFLKDKGTINLGNIVGTFAGFPLGSKASARKTILFGGKGAEDLAEGTYVLEVFALTSDSRELRLMTTFTEAVTAFHIENIRAGHATGNMNRKIDCADIPVR